MVGYKHSESKKRRDNEWLGNIDSCGNSLLGFTIKLYDKVRVGNLPLLPLKVVDS